MKTCNFSFRSASWWESLQSCTIGSFNTREEAEKQGESRSTHSGLCLPLDWIKYNMKLYPEWEACKFIQRRLSLLLLVENSQSWGFTVWKMWWNSSFRCLVEVFPDTWANSGCVFGCLCFICWPTQKNGRISESNSKLLYIRMIFIGSTFVVQQMHHNAYASLTDLSQTFISVLVWGPFSYHF